MKQAFHFKGGNFTISAISINVTELKQIESLLKSKMSQSESFFRNAPFAIDITNIDDQESCDIKLLNSIFECFKKSEMIPIGFVTNNKDIKSQLVKNGHNILKKNSLKDSANEENSTIFAKIITTPVRTGQQIKAEDTDVIIMANVNNGAEIVADGSVIVYGQIGGRVIAGSSGNKDAKIICKDLKADLVSIAGKYVTLNNESPVDAQNCKNGYVVFLKDDKIYIEGF